MKKIYEFLKTNIIVLKWTCEYFICLSLILWFLFKFNVLSLRHWWIFFHATLHGFCGFVFGVLMYSAIPLYIATTLIIYRKKTPIFTISMPEKMKNILNKMKDFFYVQPESVISSENTPVSEPETEQAPEYPSDMPRELYVPYMRAKQNLPLTSAISTFNKQPEKIPDTQKPEEQNESFPIPSDFDISDSLPDANATNSDFSDGEFPVFKDINFDIPITQPTDEISNDVTKYCDAHNIEYETYHDFVATEKYVIYEHNDDDFWIMDDDSWFASKKHRESPIPELLELAQQNDLTPVLYLKSQNIMDLPGTTERFESMGIRIITNLDEL